MKVDYMRLVHYIDCASNLAEGLTHDIKRNKSRLSVSSIVNLNKFYQAAYAVQHLLDAVEIDKKDIQ